MAIFTVTRALEAVFQGDSSNDTINAHLFVDGDFDDRPTMLADLAGGGGEDSIRAFMEAYDATVRSTIRGGEGNDDIHVDIYSESVIADVAFDLDGGSGNDTIDVRIRNYSSGIELPTISSVRGGDGNDVIKVELFQGPGTTNNVFGGSGDDTITALVSSATEEGHAIGNDVDGGRGDDILDLSAESGGMSATPFNDATGGDGDDRITAKINLTMFDLDSTARNTVFGDDGDDRLSASITTDGVMVGHSELYGGEGDDRLSVKGGEGNRLEGNEGSDVLLGGAGSDRLIGGQGDDYLRGRGGEDFFVFGSIRAGERDRIVDFVIGEDTIDLGGIDARVGVSGNQGFAFGTSHGTGRAWIEQSSGSSSLLHADNGRDVLEVVLQDGRDVGPGDYSASDFIL